MRKTILRGLAVGALAVALAAQPARADISTSMTAELSGGDIIFLLSATQPGTFWLHDLTITSSDWLFDGNIANVAIREGGQFGTDRTANYVSQFVDGNLTFESNSAVELAAAAMAPIWIKVGLASVGQNATDIEYAGDFFTQGDPNNPGRPLRTPVDSFGGTVTPEPVSMVLLGTGLAGIAGARRRRKQNTKLAV